VSDLIYVGVAPGFFTLSWAFATLCGRVQEDRVGFLRRAARGAGRALTISVAPL
jgi:hypothetical protein